MMLSPELDENTEKLTDRARELINAEFRNLLWDNVTKKIRASQLQTYSPQQPSASKVSKTTAVKTARKKIREEWDALKNATIISNDSPEGRLSEALAGVVAYIEIANVPKSVALRVILENLGATVSDTFTPVVTHVIFKRGTLETFKRARLLNVQLVSVLWIEACKNARRKIPEDLFPVPEHSEYSSPRTFRRFVEEMDSEERRLLVMRAARRVTGMQPPTDNRRITRSSTQNDSSESNIKLQISTDESGKKTTVKHNKVKKATEIDKDQPAKVQAENNKSPNKRRLFASAGDETIDYDGNKKNKPDDKIKRKLFTQNRLDETTLEDTASSDSSTSSGDSVNVRGVNPYQIPVKPKTAKKKKQPIEKKAPTNVKRKEKNIVTDDESSSGRDSPNSSVERREQVRELMKITQIQSETNKKLRKRRLIKEKKKKKLTKEERENIMRANKIARRQENEIIKASQPRSCKKVNIYNDYSKGIPNPSLVSTFLHRTENRWLKQCIDRLGGFTFKAAVERDTTHVVSGGPVRTINLLKGLSRGCWLVDKRWVEESARAGHWLTEHDYELVKFSPAVQKCRIERQALGPDYRMDIFRGCGGVYVSEHCTAKRRDLRALLSLCHGTPVSEAGGARVVVGERAEGATCVSEMWLLDSVAAGRCRSLKSYVIV